MAFPTDASGPTRGARRQFKAHQQFGCTFFEDTRTQSPLSHGLPIGVGDRLKEAVAKSRQQQS